MEEKIAKIASGIIGGSIILLVVIGFLLFGIMSIASGDFSVMKNPFMLKIFFVTILYIFSIFLLATLSGKGIRRRLVSWIFSFVFHAGFLLYLGFMTEFSIGILIIGLPETLIILLSIAGLFTLLYKHYKAKESM